VRITQASRVLLIFTTRLRSDNGSTSEALTTVASDRHSSRAASEWSRWVHHVW